MRTPAVSRRATRSAVTRVVAGLVVGASFASAFVAARAGDPPKSVTVRVHGGDAVLHGRAVDASGAPLGGAEVRAYAAALVLRDAVGADHLGDVDLPADEGRTTAGGDGTFEVRGLALGPYVLRVTAAGHGVAVATACASATPGPDGDVVLGDAVAVEGRVVDAAGKGMAGVAVAAKPASPTGADDLRIEDVVGRAVARTDGDGRFRIGDAPATVHDHPLEGLFVVARAPNGRVATVRLLGKPPFPDAAHSPPWALAGTASLSGSVTDAETKAAIARARCWAIVGGGGDAGRTTLVLAETDDHGEFKAEGVPAGSLDVVFVQAIGVGASLEQPKGVALRDGASATVALAVHRGPSVSGQITTPGASANLVPVAGAEVLALHRGVLFAQSAVTDAEGRYRLEGLPAPSGASGVVARLRVTAPGLAPRDARPLDVSLGRMGGRETRSNLHLVPCWSIEGTVTDAAGKPLAGASVVPAPVDLTHGPVDEWLGVTTDAAGRFSITDVSPRDLRLVVRPRGASTTTSVDVPVHGGEPAKGIEIRVGAGAGSSSPPGMGMTHGGTRGRPAIGDARARSDPRRRTA